jgi:phosphopantetheinyl transferase (holo-ACP synthase)
MAEIAFTTAQTRRGNDLQSANFASKQAVLLANGDTTPWQLCFEEFSVFMSDNTTGTVTVELAFKNDKSDAFALDTQTETERGANYEFTGFAWVRLVRTANTGSNPRVTLSYRED